MIKLAPSILAADFAILGQQIKETDEAGAPYIHLDVMDGAFVPSISFGMPVISSVRKVTDQVLDVHLMINEPERYIEEFKECGADIITFHLEAAADPHKLLTRIRSMGIKAGISIKPETSVEAVLPYLEAADMILVMCVNPGFGGQQFISQSLERVRQIRNYLDSKGLWKDIEVDGGLYHDNVKTVLEAGANVIVAGTAVFNGDISRNINLFQIIFDEYEDIKGYKEYKEEKIEENKEEYKEENNDKKQNNTKQNK